MRASRDASTSDLQLRPSVSFSYGRLSLPVTKTSSGVQSSATWTSNSGDLGAMSDTDDIGNREGFVEEYNRLAKKYGIRPLVPDDPANSEAIGILPKRRWWSRTFRRTSSQSTENTVRRQRSLSHVASHLAHIKRDSLKDQDLQGLVRLCGKSFFYLPPEYAPGSLILPTCFRATAQYLVQHAPETRGIFRIPGSVRVVNELYEFYCAEQAGEDVASTVRSPNIPAHIDVSIHDVASCFKKFLAGLPGGILGSLSLFDALIAINSQLCTDPEFSRTKQSKIRARLIALAIGTLGSQFRRELICAVFGLLCLLGRAAETTPREDEHGRPLPTSDLMGYNALGIIFGPLLVGDMLGSHAVKLSDPSSGLFIVPVSPSPKSKKEKKKAKETVEESTPVFLDVDKVYIANDITEMLITNWRDVVRQMRSLGGNMSLLRRHSCTSNFTDEPRHNSSSIKDNGSLVEKESSDRQVSENRPSSSTASSSRVVSFRQMDSTNDAISVKRTRPKPARSVSNVPDSKRVVLSPPREDPVGEGRDDPRISLLTPRKSSLKSSQSKNTMGPPNNEDPANDENVSPTNKNPTPIFQSPSKIGRLQERNAKSTPQEQSSTSPANTRGVEDIIDERSELVSRRLSPGKKSSAIPKPMGQIDGSPERLQPLCELDTMIGYRAGPGIKILKAHSTMRSQPKMTHMDPEASPTQIRSCVWKTSSRGSASSGVECDEKVMKTSYPGPKQENVILDQMDGTMDIDVYEDPRRGSFLDLKREFERRETVNVMTTSSPGFKSRPPPLWILSKPNKLSMASPADTSVETPARLKIGSRGEVKSGTNKVKGLAAMFDSAAKGSPLLTTTGGAIQKKRRETAIVVSPYTSNPSPRASLQTTTSVSTPVSFPSPSKNSFDLLGTAENTIKKSLIPRSHHSPKENSGTAKKQCGPTSAERDEPHCFTTSSASPSKIPTLSRLTERKLGSGNDFPLLPQLDGPSKISQPPLKITVQETRTTGYYSSPTTQANVSDGYKSLPYLTQNSTVSGAGEDESIFDSMESSGFTPSLSRGRSDSMRDRIRSLRSELSTKNEDYVQLRLEFEEFRKMKEVGEILLREDLDRTRVDATKWKRRAERAERKLDKYEKLAMRIGNERDYGNDENDPRTDDYSLMRGFDHINVAERTPQPLAARMNQSTRRTPQANSACIDVSGSVSGDVLSDCSGSTVVRNITATSCGEEDAASGTGLWTAVNELVDLTSPGFVDNHS